ncbi:flavodoxin family protein [Anaeromyxobacter oryzisoli]|uniref:flavodoxin family protein n=1 Tax=Anaeromyxobacter oryzisoli TaxID=2925408 RepID=UPI001F589517|nr:NAD(P)H-dependent oxidoreductase [Anaeromyxobacter sp. SG63]
MRHDDSANTTDDPKLALVRQRRRVIRRTQLLSVRASRTLLESMIAADVIVLATPVYFFGKCAQLKTVIDRTVARYTAIANKEFYFIVTAAVGSKRPLERTIEGLRGFTSCLTGAKEKGIVYGTGAWEVGDILSRPAFEEAYEMGKSV